jgi:hypothetical protein
MINSTPALTAPDSSVPQVVNIDGGTVTLVDLEGLRTRIRALQAGANEAEQQAKSLRTLADDLWVQAGRIMITSRGQWAPAPPVAILTQQAVSLTDKAASSDSQLQAIQAKEHHGLSGFAGKLGDWTASKKLSNQRAEMESLLRILLAQIARQSLDAALPELQSIRGQALAADTQVQELEARAKSLSMGLIAATAELQRRTEAEHEMGFDAPYTAAYVKLYGPPEVQSPLILKRGERACAAVPATLARQQSRRQWVGGSQGFSFPIGHTGIRYRVGSFHGHPIQQQVLGRLDSGTLVITNQRLAFIGKVKSTNVAYAKVMHIECYSDALAVFQEGRENPDFYLTAQPKYALFMINWFLSAPAS